MNIYKIYKGDWAVKKKFASIQDAEAFAASLGEGYSVEYVGPYVPPTTNDKLQQDIIFLSQLTDRFLTENRDAGITEIESLELMQQFSSILSFSQVGAVLPVYDLLQNVTTSRVYTQERKSRDLQDIQNYLNQ